MDKDELLKIFDRQQRMEVQIPGVIYEEAGLVIRHRTPGRHSGFIAFSALDEATADLEIEAQVDFFDSQGISFEWKVYDHDKPADLRRRLAARGFEIEPPEALMVLDLESAPDFYWSISLPPIVRITDQTGINDLVRMEEEVWQDARPWLGNGLAYDLQHLPDLLNIFAVVEDQRVVSAAWVYFHPASQFASLWGGSTLEAYRRRGFYTALLVIRAREARKRGFRFLTVDASPMSRPILEKHGFQFLGFSTPCIWNSKPPEIDVPETEEEEHD